ncbi:uncharacterized protein UMAG_12339 [Mycosarcoma maydis]|uniref:Uncharacterized protein n=1 Tax=Mycosarcoma maydis TaxID=5270 RepID=A0A0D1DMJ2_MYCMD|nr:uncharacterized protein UMAG_12339 [Ustilago maydis 521]KIS65749.1 hypothetical protein UMAG_12339 [Ustilago maydis 521]|eukprot:XP_011392762.1 hypothetical protein UMAG_12339 [Ustilago maydis 521]
MAVSVDAAGARGVVQRRADVTASGVLPHGQDERAPGVCTRIRRRRLVRVVRLPPIRSAGALLPSIRASKLCLVCAGILAADKAVTSEAETCNASGAKYGRAYRACLGSALSRLLAAMLRAERQRCQHPSSDTWSLWSLTWNSENADCNDGQRRCSVLTKISACRNDARQKARTGGVRTGVRPSLDGETQPSKRSTASRRQAALPHRTAQAKAQVEHVDCGRWSRASVLELEHWVEHDPACAPLTRRVHTVTPPRPNRSGAVRLACGGAKRARTRRVTHVCCSIHSYICLADRSSTASSLPSNACRERLEPRRITTEYARSQCESHHASWRRREAVVRLFSLRLRAGFGWLRARAARQCTDVPGKSIDAPVSSSKYAPLAHTRSANMQARTADVLRQNDENESYEPARAGASGRERARAVRRATVTSALTPTIHAASVVCGSRNVSLQDGV